MEPVGLGNTRILTGYVQKPPWTLMPRECTFVAAALCCEAAPYVFPIPRLAFLSM